MVNKIAMFEVIDKTVMKFANMDEVSKDNLKEFIEDLLSVACEDNNEMEYILDRLNNEFE